MTQNKLVFIMIIILLLFGLNSWVFEQKLQANTGNHYSPISKAQTNVFAPKIGPTHPVTQMNPMTRVSKVNAGPISVACVFMIGGLGDKSHNDMAYAGLQKAQTDGLVSTFDYYEPATNSDFEPMLNSYASSGTYDLIIAVGFRQKTPVENVASIYPTQPFLLIDDIVTVGNVSSVVFRENEGSFLVGALAGLMTQTGKIGFIGGMDLPLIREYWAGYKAGAFYERNGSFIEVMENFLGLPGDPWNDPATAKAMAEAMWAQGVDIIFAAAGNSGLGVHESANEQGPGFYSIGVDGDQDYLYPGSILTSTMERFDVAVYNGILDVYNSNWSPDVKNLGLAENGVGISNLTYTSSVIGPTIIQEVNVTVRNKIISGEFTVPKDSTSLDQWITDMGISFSFSNRGPITITSDYWLNKSGFPGNGTIDDPIRIERYNITAASGNLISISDTTYYFRISNCLLNSLTTIGRGIEFYNVRHGTIEDNVILNAQEFNIGIFLSSSDNITIVNNSIFDNNGAGISIGENSNNNSIVNNTIYNNDQDGIILDNGTNNIILNNIVYNNGWTGIKLTASADNNIIDNNTAYDNTEYGIWLGETSSPKNNTIVNNTVHDNGWGGISVWDSTNNLITENGVYNNSRHGIFIRTGSANKIYNNTIYYNEEYGINLEQESEDNTIEMNDFSENNAEGISQANDDGSNNVFRNNYWSDWTGSGEYAIDGSAGNQDPSPLTNSYHLSAPIITAPTAENLTLTGVVFIQWNASIDSFGHSLNYSVLYSTNDGTSWTTLASDLIITNHTFDTMLIADGPIIFKVHAIDSIGFTSISILEETFLIANDQLSSPTILSPNGGETLNETITIEWTASLDSLDHAITYTIYYSADNGATWTQLATGLTATSYAWDTTVVPNGFSYLIKVVATCSEGETAKDLSDGLFTIQNVILTLTTTAEISSTTTPSPIPGMTGLVLLVTMSTLIVMRKGKKK